MHIMVHLMSTYTLIATHFVTLLYLWLLRVIFINPSATGCIGVARILSGVHFFAKKTDDLFLVVALKERLNIPPNLTRPAKTVQKIDSCSGWGCPKGGALTHFPCKLRLKKIFHRPGGAGAPTAPPGYAYDWVTEICWQSFAAVALLLNTPITYSISQAPCLGPNPSQKSTRVYPHFNTSRIPRFVNISEVTTSLSLIHIWRCRRIERCRSRWSPYH